MCSRSSAFTHSVAPSSFHMFVYTCGSLVCSYGTLPAMDGWRGNAKNKRMHDGYDGVAM